MLNHNAVSMGSNSSSLGVLTLLNASLTDHVDYVKSSQGFVFELVCPGGTTQGCDVMVENVMGCNFTSATALDCIEPKSEIKSVSCLRSEDGNLNTLFYWCNSSRVISQEIKNIGICVENKIQGFCDKEENINKIVLGVLFGVIGGVGFGCVIYNQIKKRRAHRAMPPIPLLPVTEEVTLAKQEAEIKALKAVKEIKEVKEVKEEKEIQLSQTPFTLLASSSSAVASKSTDVVSSSSSLPTKTKYLRCCRK